MTEVRHGRVEIRDGVSKCNRRIYIRISIFTTVIEHEEIKHIVLSERRTGYNVHGSTTVTRG